MAEEDKLKHPAKQDVRPTTREASGLGGKSDAAKREEEILAFWKENKTFERSLDKSAPKGEFVFYDGPPFATGLPHYGSLLSSIIKDVIPRYKTMRGYHVRRRWGWDTHGLPIENLAEKELGLKTKKEIEEIGIAKFNETARSLVLRYVADWKHYIERVGRWVDYDNSYKTMDNTYIGSVWWALKSIYDKGLLYEGKKVLMYCTHCETPLAKAEIAADNTYKDITEEAITVKFKVKDSEKHGLPANTYLLAWTTTPWTLPGNVALAVGAEVDYAVIKLENEVFITAQRQAPAHSTIIDKKAGVGLVGLEYEPVFDVPHLKSEKSYKVVAADFVSTEEGTGIVHIAPMYGEDDFTLGVNNQLPTVQLLTASGAYNELAPEFIRGKYLRDANKDIKHDLQERGLLFARENHTHSYPHCWRCGTPLIYNAVSSWFINIQKVKARMLEENEKVNWVPEHLKHGRFGKIVESAPDWTISRNRFWASPLPIWKSKDRKVMVIGSLGELREKVKKSGNTYFTMRHGEAENNLKGILSSVVPGVYGLTKEGKETTRKAAENLKGQKIDLIFASPVRRAQETAQIVAEVLSIPEHNVIIDERIREQSMGEFEKGLIQEHWKLYTTSADQYELKPKGGESAMDGKRRMGAFVYDLESKYSDKNILIVSHGGPIWGLKAAARGASLAEMQTMHKEEYPPKGMIEKLDFAPIPVNANYELDLHRPYTDALVLLDDEGCEYERIKEVVDCWVESGCMPFAEYHYPFENKEEFEKRFPGDFIAEYIAQTRTWFYYLHAIGVILFDKLTFRNVVTTGTIVAADGSKMSKSKGNYTDPLELIALYGADALRLYLMSSPVMQAEDLRFRDEDVRDAHNRVLGILWNTFKFFDLYQKEFDGTAQARKSEHVLDRWILALLDETTKEITDAFEAYDTPRACRAIRAFVDDYSTWYVRRSRERVKSEWHEKQFALATQREVLLTFSRLIAPIMPFIAEAIWRGIEGGGSVHLQEWPTVHNDAIGFFARLFKKSDTILGEMAEARSFVTKALEVRDKAGIKVRQPLHLLEIGSTTLSKELRDVIRDEVNVKEAMLSADVPAGEVKLDTTITSELEREGLVRDIIRAGQEQRKLQKYEPADRLTKVRVLGSAAVVAAVNEYQKDIQEALKAEKIEVQEAETLSVSITK